ncbi:DNA cytosine methyltransferase, partial [Roseivivax isoporae]
VLRGCDYGAPTIRKRMFWIARRDGRPIVWPAPTLGDPKSAAVRSGRLQPWRTAAECIDWSLPCPSIFATSAEIKAKHGLRAVRPLAKNTLARIARGMKRYVLEAERPFIVNLTHGARVEDAADPLRTITCANRGEKAVVAPSITRFNGGATGQDARDPLATVTANSWIKRPGGAAPLGVVAPTLANVANSKTTGRGPNAWTPEEPLRTITSANGHALVASVLTYAQQGGGNRDIRDPHHTICASTKDQNMVLAPGLVHIGNGERPGQAPRCYDPAAPLGTIVAAGPRQYPFAAFLAQQNNDSRRIGGVNPGRPALWPMSTVTASGSHQTPVAAFIARQFGASVGHAASAPHGTITAGGQGKSAPVAAWFAKYYGTGDGARQDEPCHTVTTRDRFGHAQAELAAPPFTDAHAARAREVAEFLRAHDAWSGGEFVTLEIDGETFVVVDIGLRMLTPRELFNAQGFPPDYVIEGVWRQDEAGEWAWHPFSKDVQISCCGNSVCPDVAEALVSANCAHLMAKEAAA